MATDPTKQFSQADLDAARAAGKTEGESGAKATAKTETETAAAAAAKASQDRIAGILGHAEAEGREGLAKHLAFKTTSSIDDAVALLAAAPKEAKGPKNPLADAMGKVPNPKVGAGGDGDEKVVSINASGIYAARRKQAGHAK